jgi:hypothetical protein
MRLWTAEQRDALFDQIQRDAFHLELRDTYHVDSEDESYRRWSSGEPPDPSDYDRPWLGRIRMLTSSGKTVRRVRVVSEPVTQYIQYEYDGTDQNIAAGEDIRWLPRQNLPDGIAFPAEGRDWWLFDDHLVAIGYVDEHGRPLGSHVSHDRDLVGQCTYTRDRLWPIATPHRAYRPV